MMIPDNENPEARKHIRIEKIMAHLDLVITSVNMMMVCRQAGLPYPKGVSFDSFNSWLSDYLGQRTDRELISIMKKLGLTVVSSPEEWEGIFIIHSGKDSHIANKLTKALNIIDINDSMIYCSSVEETGTEIGTSFVETIAKYLKRTKLAICLLSGYCISSAYCLQEMGATMILDIPIIPILIDIEPSHMPGFLDSTRYISTNIDSEAGAKLFLKGVCKAMDVEPASASIALGVQKLIGE